MSLSVRCFSNGPLRRTAAVLELYRAVADEIVCVVDGRFSPEQLAPLADVADRILPCEMGPDFSSINPKAWLYSYECDTDWILLIDHDEVPGAALLQALPELTAARDVVSYPTTRRWLFPDQAHWIDEYPWEPDWLLSLVRNDPAAFHFGARIHESTLLVEPYRYKDLPVYHLDCALNSYEARRAKVADYDAQGEKTLEDGRSISAVYYLPEEYASSVPVAVPNADRANIDAVLAIDVSGDRSISGADAPVPLSAMPNGTISHAQLLEAFPGRVLPGSAYRATITLRNWARSVRLDLSTFRPGESRPLTAVIRNDGTQRWPRSWREPRIALSTRWYRAAERSAAPVAEGARAAFTADVPPGTEILQPFVIDAPAHPGDYLLAVDLVHEEVRWFGCEVLLPVTVVA